MTDVGRAIFAAACAVGYAPLRVFGVPGRPDAVLPDGEGAWRKTAEWLGRPGRDGETIGAVVDAIDAEYRRQQEILVDAFAGDPAGL